MKHVRALFAALIAVLSTALLIGLAAAPNANADPAATPVVVTIDSFTPVNPQPGKTLRISGRVVNTGNVAISGVRVRMRLSPSPLTNRNDVGQLARGDIGPADDGPDVYTFDWFAEDVAAELAPNEEATFAMKVGLDSLPLNAAGVYAVGIEALGQNPDDGYARRQGLTRTFLPWFPASAMQPTAGTTDGLIAQTGLVWLWPLSDWPARDANGVLLNDRTPNELAPGGRLSSLLDAASTHPTSVSWVLDSELIQTVDDMSDGYQVASANGPVVGDKANDAENWFSKLVQATAPVATGRRSEPVDQALYSLPYANIDASAVRRAGLERDVVRAVTMSSNLTGEAMDRRMQQNVYWAPSGVIDQPTADALTAAGVSAFVLADTAMPPTEHANITPSGIAKLNTGSGDSKAILRDSGLSASLMMPAHTDSERILARQRFLAELGVATTEDPAHGRTLVAGPNNVLWDADPILAAELLDAVNRVSFVRPTPLAELLELPLNDPPRDRVRYGTANRNAELSDSYLAHVKDAQQQLTELSSVVDDPAGIIEPMNQALIRSESAAWRGEPETGERLLRNLTNSVSADIDQVRILSKGSVTFSGDNGIVPVTIANDFDRSVTVGIQLVGQPTLRLESTPVHDITIAPGKNATVEIPVRVIGGGMLPVSAQLLTPDGELYGKPTQIELTSTAYARAAAWVIGIAFAAIAVFVVFGIVRRIHGSRSPNSTEKSGNLES